MSIVTSGPFARSVPCSVSVSSYYAWRRRSESKRSIENRALLDDIRQTHAESGGCYGAPRIYEALRAAGRQIGRHRVARLMRLAGLRGLAAIPRRVRTTDSRHDYPIAPNRLRRNFTATAPNQVWLANLTYIRTGEGWFASRFRGPTGATVPAHSSRR